MSAVNYTKQLTESAIIFRFDGEFTIDNTGSFFDKVLSDIMANGKFDVIVNMNMVDTINSRVAGGLAGIYEKIDIFGGSLYVTNMNQFVDDALDLLGMYLFLKKAPTEESALKDLTK